MIKRKNLYLFFVIVAMTISMLVVPALADAGNFSGKSDFGGSFSGSSGGSSGSSALWGLAFLGSSGGSGGGIIFFIIVLYIVLNIIKKRKNIVGGAPMTNFTDYSELMPIETIHDKDPNFSEEAIKEKIANLYVQMQDAWQNKKFESMRPHMTDTLYNQFNRQLDELINSDCTNFIERIAVLNVSLTGWKTNEVNDSIVAIVNTRIIDYTVNDKTGKIISGSKSAEKFMTYEWTLIRSKGMTSPTSSNGLSDGTESIHCPSCGAPVEINQSAKCPYCDSIITARDFDWSISSIRGISQRTEY